MLSAYLYHTVYLSLVTVLTILVGRGYGVQLRVERTSSNFLISLPSLFLAVAVTLFVGLRPVDITFVDMVSYEMVWDGLSQINYEITWDTDNVIFDNLMGVMSGTGIQIKWFFLLMAAINILGIWFSCDQMFPNDRIISFLVCLGAFSTFSYATNGIKAGSAASLFLVALAFNDKGKFIWTVVFLLLSLGFHHSMILPIAAFIVCKFVKKPQIFHLLWFLSFILAALHITYFQNLFGSIVDEQGAMYLLGNEHIKTSMLGGFRIDFILYSFVPIVIGYYAVSKKWIRSKNYLFLLNLYTLANSIWMLCMYAEFTNRIAYLSWFMYPIVLIYPFLREDWGEGKYHTFKLVAYGHLAFTLFMAFVYYA